MSGTRAQQIDIADVKREAQGRLGEVLSALGVREPAASGGYISMCNPMLKDRHPSFTIWIKGPAAGAWKDHRDDGPGGTRGDVIDLVSYLSGWWERPKKGRGEAIRWLIETLGLGRIDPAELLRDRERARREQKEREKTNDEAIAAKQARAFALFVNAAPIGGTLAEAYLAARGIDFAALPQGPRGGDRTPKALRYLASHKHSESGRELPCMIACCTNRAGQILAVHRTWLDRDTGNKADVFPVKKVWPAFSGLVIPLWRGESGLTVREAIACGLRETLMLTEGIEDGLSAVLAAPRHRVWAFIALGNLGNIVLPECIDGVMLHRQTEWENRTAVSAFARGKRALEAQGRPVAEVTAFAGKDLNDTLRGAAA